jgi:dienelactone hydrolase
VVLLALAALAASCSASSATAPPPASPPTNVTKPADALDDASEQLIAALNAGDATRAELHFSTQLRAALPPDALAGVWRSLVEKNGPLTSAHTVDRDQLHGYARRMVELRFRDQTMTALLAFDSAASVAGIFFRTTGGDGQPSAEAASRERETERQPTRSIPVKIGDEPHALSGEIMLPASTGSGKLAGAVLVAGSGPNDRDETIGAAKPFRDLAIGLARRGVATIRFDKRTFSFPGTFDPIYGTVEDEVIRDAVQAVKILRAQPEVDPARLFVIGHSLGAWLAPEIAQRVGGAAGLVLLAAPGRPLLDVFLDQLRAAGYPAADIQRLESQARTLAQLPDQEKIAGASAYYWRDLAARDEMQIARRLGKPVLLIRGELDQNVLAVDQRAWETALAGSPAAAQTLTFAGLAHTLTPAASLGGHVPGDLIDAIARFVAARRGGS